MLENSEQGDQVVEPIFTTSRRIHADDFNQQWLKDRACEMGETVKYHRKVWELCAEAQVFVDHVYSSDYLLYPTTYRRILGFGVGREPLPAWFAHYGANVVATDAPLTDDIKRDWSDTGQHSKSVDDLRHRAVDEPGEILFGKHVTYEAVDMNDIPAHLLDGSFDMTYSTSSFEHIGGIDKSLAFFCRQMSALKPGGIACHTTEYNFGSNVHTLESDNLVLFRKCDLERLDDMLRSQGDELWPLDLDAGTSELDKIIDVIPYEGKVHLSLKIGPWVSTSVMLIARRGSH